VTHEDNNNDESKKERVLHTRVPAVLEKELKKLATNLRVPVSNVVRAILEDAVTVADIATKRTEDGLRSWAGRLSDERDRLKDKVAPSRIDDEGPAETDQEIAERDPLAGILGFQSLMLASPARCARCDGPLAAGDEAFLGIREVPGGKRIIVGKDCLPMKTKKKEGES
jgi:hypothetical protein